MQKAIAKIHSFLNREEGQGMVEYALILGLIVVVVAAVMGGLGTEVKGIFTSVTNTLKGQ